MQLLRGSGELQEWAVGNPAEGSWPHTLLQDCWWKKSAAFQHQRILMQWGMKQLHITITRFGDGYFRYQFTRLWRSVLSWGKESNYEAKGSRFKSYLVLFSLQGDSRHFIHTISSTHGINKQPFTTLATSIASTVSWDSIIYSWPTRCEQVYLVNHSYSS